MARVKIYTSGFCPYCVMAKRLLQKRAVPYEEIRMDSLASGAREDVCRRTGMRTVPQIMLDDGTLIGGYDQLEALDRKEGGLDSLK